MNVISIPAKVRRAICLAACVISILEFASAVRAATIISGGILDPDNGATYYLLSQDSWLNSEAQAVAMGGTLATVTSNAENAWIASTFGTNRNLWIGLWDPSKDLPGGTHASDFVWASGSKSTYRNYAPGEPNNALQDEYYTTLWGNSADIAANPSVRSLGTWNDVPNTASEQNPPQFVQPFGVVEVTAVPEPASLGTMILGMVVTLRRSRVRFSK